MLIVVSPAKALDYSSKLPTRKHSQPRMLDEASPLVDVMRQKSPDEIAKLMGISDELAELNFERYADWEAPFTTGDARPALLAFAGDVYQGMDAAATFTERDYTHSQKVLRILSGLYGVLRPLDLMQPYRLEMGSKLATERGRDLYSYWGERITDMLNADLAESPGPAVVVNLASNEYFRSVDAGRLEGRLVTPAFLDGRGRRRAQDDLVLRQAGPGRDGGLDHPQPAEVGAGPAGTSTGWATGSTPSGRPPTDPCSCGTASGLVVAETRPDAFLVRVLRIWRTKLSRDSGTGDSPEIPERGARTDYSGLRRGTGCAEHTAMATLGSLRGCSSMVEHQLPKLRMRVQFSSSAPRCVSRVARLRLRELAKKRLLQSLFWPLWPSFDAESPTRQGGRVPPFRAACSGAR